MSTLNDNCGICGELMKDRGYKVYGCELCPTWLHAKCVFPNASEAKLKILFEFNSSFDVKCKACQQNLKVKLADLVTKDDFSNLTSSIEQKFKTGLNITEDCAHSLQKNQVSELKATFAEALKGSNSLIGDIGQKLDKFPDIALQLSEKKEEDEKLKRKNNLILFKLPESAESEPEEQIKADCSAVKNILEERVTISSGEVVNITRLGRKEDNKVRPLLIKFKNEEKKWEVLKSSKGLRLLRDNVSYPLFMSVDRTLKEQQSRKILLKELRERKNNGEENLMIRNNSIIKKPSLFRLSAKNFWDQLF